MPPRILKAVEIVPNSEAQTAELRQGVYNGVLRSTWSTSRAVSRELHLTAGEFQTVRAVEPVDEVTEMGFRDFHELAFLLSQITPELAAAGFPTTVEGLVKDHRDRLLREATIERPLFSDTAAKP